MSLTDWTEQDTERALRAWDEYQRHNDVSAQIGQTVGIDPDTGRVWFGASASAIRKELDASKVNPRLLFLRVGSRYYLRKGSCR